MYKDKFISIIIAAAGMSNRMGSKINKQFLLIDNKPILAHSIEAFNVLDFVDEIIVVSKEEEVDYCKKEIIYRYGFNKVSKIVKGGKERQDSIYNGIISLNPKTDIVLTHDGARPFIRKEAIIKGIEGAIQYGACVIGVPLKDTIKVVEEEDLVHHTPNRSLLWAAQTPQCFQVDLLKEGYEYAISEGIIGTDDSSLVEKKGYPVKMLLGNYDNIKITTPEDLVIAESFLNKDHGSLNEKSRARRKI